MAEMCVITRMRRIILLLLLAFPVTLAAAETRPAPDFALPTSSGTVSLHDLRGKVVYVDFWASWCGPCRQSFPWMNSMLEKYRSQGLVIVAVDLDKTRDAAGEFLYAFSPKFTVAFDPAGKTAEAYRVEAMPSSFLVDRDGKIVYTHEGFESSKAATLEQKIRESLK